MVKESNFIGKLKKKLLFNAKMFNSFSSSAGDGIFSRIPQLIIDVIGFFAGLFPAQDNDYDVPEYTPDPDSEPITTTTQANTEKYRIRGRSRRYFI